MDQSEAEANCNILGNSFVVLPFPGLVSLVLLAQVGAWFKPFVPPLVRFIIMKTEFQDKKLQCSVQLRFFPA